MNRPGVGDSARVEFAHHMADVAGPPRHRKSGAPGRTSLAEQGVRTLRRSTPRGVKPGSKTAIGTAIHYP